MKSYESLYSRVPELSSCADSIERAVNIICSAFRGGGKLLLCGNGGSCADCDHIAGELLKGFLSLRPMPEDIVERFRVSCGYDAEKYIKSLQRGLPAISLCSHSAAMTAYINDAEPELVYAQLVYALGNPGDVLLGISTSGRSASVRNALCAARALGLKTIILTGASVSLTDALGDVSIKVPSTDTYRIQEYHLPVYHHICAEVEMRMFCDTAEEEK